MPEYQDYGRWKDDGGELMFEEEGPADVSGGEPFVYEEQAGIERYVRPGYGDQNERRF